VYADRVSSGWSDWRRNRVMGMMTVVRVSGVQCVLREDLRVGRKEKDCSSVGSGRWDGS